MKSALLTIFLAVSLGVLLAADVKLTQGSDRIMVEIDGKPFTDFFIGSSAVKPYLHPLRSPSGKIVTRMYPMENVEGEPRDHPHHRGLWFTHGDVNGIDFWMNEQSSGQERAKRGKINTKKITRVESGKKSGTIGAIFEWRAPDDKLLLTENRTMVFYSDPVNRVIDFDIQLTAADTVKFGDTKEGTFAVRLTPSLQEKDGTGKMINASGATGEKNVWGKPSPWVDYSGEVKGEKLGIAILDHPTNPKHPTHWHSRAYGLFAANIFGLHDFTGDKTQDGSVTLKPGDSIRFRYRVVIHPGETESAGIAKLFEKYAKTK